MPGTRTLPESAGAGRGAAARTHYVRLAVRDADLESYLRLALAGEPRLLVVAATHPADAVVIDAGRDAAPAAQRLAALRAEPGGALRVLVLGGGDAVRARWQELADPHVACLGEPFNASRVRAALLALCRAGG